MTLLFILTITILLLLNQKTCSLSPNKTLACCNNNHDNNTSSCFFKNNNPYHKNETFLMKRFIGGLGNQLFIIFTTISYAYKYNLPFLFEYSPRTVNGVRKTYWHSIYYNLICFTTKVYPAWHGVGKSLPMYEEKTFYYNKIPPPNELNLNLTRFNGSKPTGLKLRGYYQSYKYFHEYKGIIFHAMNISNVQSQNYDLYYDKYFNTAQHHVVAMHFRIGDYAVFSKKYIVLPLQYYINAIQLIGSDLNTPNMPYSTNSTNTTSIRILCVYDPKDSKQVKTDYLEPLRTKFPGIEFIVVDSAIPDWHQMLLMSLCRVIIIANSTFSW